MFSITFDVFHFQDDLTFLPIYFLEIFKWVQVSQTINVDSRLCYFFQYLQTTFFGRVVTSSIPRPFSAQSKFILSSFSIRR